MKHIFTLAEPDDPLPLVFDSPHSGTIYPDDFRYDCDFEDLQKSEDKYVDDLLIGAEQHGATVLCALFPRTYIDVNRSEKDIDHALLDDIWPDRSESTPRSLAGIGLIRRLLRPGLPVYNQPLTVATIKHRIDHYHAPYHDTLKTLLDRAYSNFGQVWHINWHSMPEHSQSSDSFFKSGLTRNADFVLGDRDGTSCDPNFTRAIRDFLKGLGYHVAINNPYKGVELVQRYSAPSLNRHSLQIEINKALYMNEIKCIKNNNYSILKNDVNRLIQFISNHVQFNLIPLAAD